MSFAIDFVNAGGFRVDWGNVPAWVGAFLTPLSLYIAYRGLLHNRLSAESEQARQVICSYFPPGEALTISIVNESSRPIRNIAIATGKVRRWFNCRYWSKRRPNLSALLWSLDPNGNVSNRIYPTPEGRYEIFVIFEDADGIGWTKSLVHPELRQRKYPRTSAMDPLHVLPQSGIANREDRGPIVI